MDEATQQHLDRLFKSWFKQRVTIQPDTSTVPNSSYYFFVAEGHVIPNPNFSNNATHYRGNTTKLSWICINVDPPWVTFNDPWKIRKGIQKREVKPLFLNLVKSDSACSSQFELQILSANAWKRCSKSCLLEVWFSCFMSDESYLRWFTSPEIWFETLQNGESVESVRLPWIPWRAAIWSRHSETWKKTSHHRLHGAAGTSERGKTQKGLKGVESCIGPFQEGVSIILVTNRLLYATEERNNKTHA